MAVAKRDPIAAFAKLSDEEDRRAREALRVYRPAQQMAFHLSHARELILRGGKRSGKSVGVVAEFASRVTGRPIYGPHGEPIPLKYPVSTPKDPLLYWVIGWDVDHIGQTLYRLLFEPGIFRVIRDKATRQWRVYNPAVEEDRVRFKESEPSEAMIPERLIDMDSWSWENKAARNFASVRLKNGALICAYPSSAKHAKQGDAVSGIWIDEDIQMPQHLKEWQDRLTDKDGWLMWSVWPHTKNYALCDMIDRAGEQADEAEPDVQQFQLIMSQNPYIPEAAKTRALNRMGSEEEIARRDRGELLLDTLSMYDFFPSVHTLVQFEESVVGLQPSTVRELLRKVYSLHAGFPHEWTRYVAIDPSHSRTAVLFGVVPPPELDNMRIGDVLIIEDELILKKASAAMLAREISLRVVGRNYEAYVMDQQMGRQTRVGSDVNVFETYASAFQEAGVRWRLCPGTFIPGCNRPQERYRAVRKLLTLQPTGIPQLLFVAHRTPVTQSEFKTYRKKQMFVAGEETILDEPANPRIHDAMACHDAATEALTDRGWMAFSALSGTERLATVNLSRNTIEYQAPTALFDAPYDGNMVQVGGMKMDALVTPEHRMVVFSRPRKADYDHLEPCIKPAGDLSPYDCVKLTAKWDMPEPTEPVLIPRAHNGNGLEKEVDQRLWAEFLGWYVAEGSCDRNIRCPGTGYRVNIAQKNLAGIAILQPLLAQLPWKWTRHIGGFSCSSKQLWSVLRGLGNCYTKRVPEWIRWSDQETIRRFMCGAIAGDGNVQFGKRNYYTSSPLLADDIQELFLKLGVSASIHVRTPKPGGQIQGRLVVATVPNFRVLEKIGRVGYLGDRMNKPNFGPLRYNGRVYCASVPNGTLITRRNGRTMISGNSLEYLSAYLETAFLQGSAWVSPEMYKSRGSAAYHHAIRILNKSRDTAQGGLGEYVHLGPGAAA